MSKQWEKELDKIQSMSNEELLHAYEDIIPGDGEDGYFSQHGEWQLEVISQELYKRLKDCGFLKK